MTFDRRTFIALGLATLAQTAHAAPRAYMLGPKGARITYTFRLQNRDVQGTVPVATTDLRIDPNDLQKSSAHVTADIRNARTGLFLATDALKSPSVLDAQRFPIVSFSSTRVILGPGRRISDGAALEGNLTMRGRTKPIRLNANLFRAPGSSARDLSRLSVSLTGNISRSEFGATGYAHLVDDTVALDISAYILADT